MHDHQFIVENEMTKANFAELQKKLDFLWKYYGSVGGGENDSRFEQLSLEMVKDLFARLPNPNAR